MSLGDKIADLRKQKGWTQEFLAEKVGVQKTQVTRWETSRMRPSMKTLKKIATVFGVQTEGLLDTEHRDEPHLEADSVLRMRLKQLQNLDPDDQALVYRIIDTFAKQKQLARVLTNH